MQSYDEKKLIQDLEEKFDLPKMIEDYYTAKLTFTADGTQELTAVNKASLRTRRDAVISGRIALINLHYNQFRCFST